MPSMSMSGWGMSSTSSFSQGGCPNMGMGGIPGWQLRMITPYGYNPYGYFGYSPFAYTYAPPINNNPEFFWDPVNGVWRGNPMALNGRPFDRLPARVPAWPGERIPNNELRDAPPEPQLVQPADQFRKSTPKDVQQALAWSEQGDHFRTGGQYREALDSYRRSIGIAEDQPAEHLKYGILLANERQYREAANELRAAMTLDPKIGESAESLKGFFGPNADQTIRNLLQSTAQWARGDIRDPERLLLVGTLLLLNGDRAQAEVPLRSAERLAPNDPQIKQIISALAVRPQDDGGIARMGFETSQPQRPRPAPVPAAIPRPAPAPSQIPGGQNDPAAGGGTIQPVPKRKSDVPAATPEVVPEESVPSPAPVESTNGASSGTNSSEPVGSEEGSSGPLFPDALN
ncbi:MAG: tetratricopeptide repeat protein [Planctomycetaceae bacterium]|nr:tetratricopeptide repeat protein [Planctomycetaceae bacterium]